MEAAKNAVSGLFGRGGDHDDTTTGSTGTGTTGTSTRETTSTTGHLGNPLTGTTGTTGTTGMTGAAGTSTTGTNYGSNETAPAYTRDDEYINRYGATGKGAGSGATAQVDSGSTTTGTALGGRASGNTADSAARATGGGTEDADGYTGRGTDSSGQYDSQVHARPIGTEPTAYHQVTGSADGTLANQIGIGTTSTGINTSASGGKITDGAADYRTGESGVGSGGYSDTTAGAGYGATRDTVGSGYGTGRDTTSAAVGSGYGTTMDSTGSGVGSGYGTTRDTTGSGVGTGYAASRDTTGISSETYPQTSTSRTSGIPGVASGDTYPRSGDLSSHSQSRTETGYNDGLSTARTSTTADQSTTPGLLSESRSKLTGSGEDGSHSAVFGLTPDGHVHDDTSHHSGGNLRPAHSKSANDTEDRRPAGTDTVAGQMDNLRVNERGDGRDPTYNVGSDTKPGAGFQAGSPDQSL